MISPSYLSALIVSLAFLNSTFAQTVGADSSSFFRLKKIDACIHVFNQNAITPSYTTLLNDFSRSNLLKRSVDFSEGTDPMFTSDYSGFKITFVFETKLLDRVTAFDFLSIAMETGVQRISLFDIVDQDSSSFGYSMDNEVFRITIGAKKFLTKKNRRLRFFTGVDWAHEWHVSSSLFEGDRKIFAQKKYSTYITAPLGFEFRFLGKKHDFEKYKSAFLSLDLGIGVQNVDPYRLVGGYAGFSLGMSFTI